MKASLIYAIAVGLASTSAQAMSPMAVVWEDMQALHATIAAETSAHANSIHGRNLITMTPSGSPTLGMSLSSTVSSLGNTVVNPMKSILNWVPALGGSGGPACVTNQTCWKATFGNASSPWTALVNSINNNMGAAPTGTTAATCTSAAATACACMSTLIAACPAAMGVGAPAPPSPSAPKPGMIPPAPMAPAAPGFCPPATPAPAPRSACSVVGLVTASFTCPALINPAVAALGTTTSANTCSNVASFPCMNSFIATAINTLLAGNSSFCPPSGAMCACEATIYGACPAIATADACSINAADKKVNCPGQCASIDTTVPAGQLTCRFSPVNFATANYTCPTTSAAAPHGAWVAAAAAAVAVAAAVL